jgi:hypothetical protein
MAASTVWKPAYDVTLIINGVTLPATTAEYSEEVEDFDTTNTESNGDHEFGVAVTTRSLRGEVPIDSDTPLWPPLKTLVAASYNDGEETHSGSIRLLSRQKRGGGRGGFMVSFSGKFTGAVTTA